MSKVMGNKIGAKQKQPNPCVQIPFKSLWQRERRRIDAQNRASKMGNLVRIILLISVVTTLSACGISSLSVIGTHFYGKIIDQNGEAVKDVSINATLGTKGWFHDSLSYHKDKTDDQGHFKISKWFLSKRGIRIHAEKRPGYDIYQVYLRAGTIINELSTKEKPWVFHAWKGKAIPLIHQDDTSYRFERDGSAYSISLISGEKYGGAPLDDIQVSFVAPKGDRISRESWQAKISVKHGGLMESDDLFMYLAPETGYKKEIVIKQNKDSPDYKEEPIRKFYLKSRGGELYAALKIKFLPFYRDFSMIRLEYWANPNGSPQLMPNLKHSISIKEDPYYKLGKLAFEAENYAEARKQLKIAADHGDRRAATLIGHLYYRGLGVSKSMGKALKWYSLALTRAPKSAVHYNYLSTSL